MENFKVIALSLGGLGNKIFKAGDEVNESMFAPGMVPKLVVQGFLKPLSEVDESEKKESENENQVVNTQFGIRNGKKNRKKH